MFLSPSNVKSVRVPTEVKELRDVKLLWSFKYVGIRLNAVLRFVPVAPSSTINKSASAKPAPISVAPSISKLSTAKAPSLQSSVVNVPAAGVLPPITELFTVPPLIVRSLAT